MGLTMPVQFASKVTATQGLQDIQIGEQSLFKKALLANILTKYHKNAKPNKDMFLNLKSLNKQQDIFFMLRSHLSDFLGSSLDVVKVTSPCSNYIMKVCQIVLSYSAF